MPKLRSTDYRFLVSGFSPSDERTNSVKKKIVELGGVYLDCSIFKHDATHLVCNTLIRSEKFLASCASGKWILTPEYIEDSYANKKWQSEEPYEWCNAPPNSALHLKDLYDAPRRHRLSEKPIFSKWKVVFFGVDDNVQQVYTRIVRAGGGAVFSFNLRVLCDKKLKTSCTHVFVDDGKRKGVSNLLNAEILCIHTDFIRNYILRDSPPDPHEFHVPYYNPESDRYYLGSKYNPKMSLSAQRENDGMIVQDAEIKYSLSGRGNCNSVLSTLNKNMVPRHKRPLRTILSPKQIPSSRHKRVKTETKTSASKKPGLRNGTLDKYVIRLPVVKMEILPDVSLVNSEKGSFCNDSEKKRANDSVYENPKNCHRFQRNMFIDSQTSFTTAAKHAEENLSTRILFNHEERSSVKKLRSLDLGIISSTVRAVPCEEVNNSMKKQCFSHTQNILKPQSTDTKSENSKLSASFITALNTRLGQLSPVISQTKGAKESFSKHTEGKNPAARVLFADDENQPVQKMRTLTSESPASKGTYSARFQSSPTFSNSVNVVTKASEVQTPKHNSSPTAVSVPHAEEQTEKENCIFRNCVELSESSTITGENTTKTSSGLLQEGLRQLALAATPKKTFPNIHSYEFTKDAVAQAAAVIGKRKTKRYIQRWTYVLSRCKQRAGKVVQAPDRFLVTFNSFTEDEEWISAIDEVMHMISHRHFPAPSVMQDLIMKMMLDAPSLVVVNTAFKALMLVLELHPPYSRAFCQYYLSISKQVAFSSSWTFMSDIIRDCVSFTYKDNDLSMLQDKFVRSRLLLLEFFLKMFELDFAYFVTSSETPADDLNFTNRQPIFVQLLWATGNPKKFNSNCQCLLQYLVKAVKCCTMYKVLAGVQKLVSYMLEYCRLSESTRMSSSGRPGTSAFTLAYGLGAIILTENLNEKQVALLLDSLDLSWVRLIVTESLLDMMGKSQLSNFNSDEVVPISMHKIVTHFMSLAPSAPAKNGGITKSFSTPLKTSSNLSTPLKLDCTPRRSSPAAISPRFSANKRNRKGETPLHLVCISNNLPRLRQLLAIPGIDVNATDNCLWTPLHEACNHGHLECVLELLKFKPLKTIKSYFSEVEPASRIDVTAKAYDDITPLHDAVIGNHLEIAEALLLFGGSQLLEAKNSDGEIPLDLADSAEMKILLKDFPSNLQNEIVGNCYTPSLSRSLGRNGYFTSKSLERYIVLVRHLVDSYIDVHNIQELWFHVNTDLSEFVKRECSISEVLKLNIMKDLQVFSDIDLHIMRFEDHLLQGSHEEVCDAILTNMASLRLSLAT